MTLDQQGELAYAVHAAFGDQAAAQALGLDQSPAGSSGGTLPSADDYVPGTDCWASAGCIDDAGAGRTRSRNGGCAQSP